MRDPYATLSELKDRLRITDETNDAQLTAALRTASRGIESACGRQFNDGGTTTRLFYVRSAYVADVHDFHTTAGLVIKTDAGGDGTFETTLTSSQYELHPLDGIVDQVTGWPYWRIRTVRTTFPTCTERASLQVTAHWGWASVPSPVKEATLILAEDVFKLRDTPFGTGGYGEYGRIRARENPNVWLRIAPYVRHPVLVA
jgi:hypothetical protein